MESLKTHQWMLAVLKVTLILFVFSCSDDPPPGATIATEMILDNVPQSEALNTTTIDQFLVIEDIIEAPMHHFYESYAEVSESDLDIYQMLSSTQLFSKHGLLSELIVQRDVVDALASFARAADTVGFDVTTMADGPRSLVVSRLQNYNT